MARKARSHVSEARERWPEAEWIIGDGRYAAVAECGDTLIVMLFVTVAEATQAQAFVDSHEGAQCEVDHDAVDPSRDHKVVDLVRERYLAIRGA